MSFNAYLTVDGMDKTRLLHCSFALNRDVDATGRPATMLRGGTIHLEIEATEKTDLFAWMVDQFSPKNGKIEFMKRDSNSTMKTLSWTDGYLVQYQESIDSIGDNPMTIHFVISARVLTVGDAEHTNPWPEA